MNADAPQFILLRSMCASRNEARAIEVVPADEWQGSAYETGRLLLFRSHTHLPPKFALSMPSSQSVRFLTLAFRDEFSNSFVDR